MARRVVLAAATALAALFILHQPVLQAAGDFLVVADPPVVADAVIAISGDGEERVGAAAELMAAGYGRFLILSGGPGRGSGSAAAMGRWARRDGVAEDRLLFDDRATSTVQNAEGSAVLMRAHGLRTALLVTSPYHMRRAIVIFRDRFAPLGLTVRAAPVRDSFFQIKDWWKLRQSRRIVIREYFELAAFLFGLY